MKLIIFILSFVLLLPSNDISSDKSKNYIEKNNFRLYYNCNENSNFLTKNDQNKSLKLEKQDFLFNNYEEIVFIGDSRTVGLSNVVTNSKITFLAEIGKGLSWLKEQNISKFNKNNTLILVNLGVNDLGNIDKYVSYLKSLNIKNLYYISVYPVDEYKESLNGYSIENNSIEKFNNIIKENFNYIDVYSYLKDNGFETKDGIHYENSSYIDIFNFLRSYKV